MAQPKVDGYAGVLFAYKDVELECGFLSSFAREFIDEGSNYVLKQAISDLENIRDRKIAQRWQIPEQRPLKTAVSRGEHQPGRTSGKALQASISFAWDIEPIPPKKSGEGKQFALNGIASTVVKLSELQEDTETCRWVWTIDIGDAKSPGTHFHAQIKEWHDQSHECLPAAEKPISSMSKLDVPRIPTLAMSPFQVVEAVIAELFQDKWRTHCRSGGALAAQWRGIQQKRLIAFAEWQLDMLKKATDATPLLALKLAKPPETVLGQSRP